MELEVNVNQVHDVRMLHLAKSRDANTVPDTLVQEILNIIGSRTILDVKKTEEEVLTNF